MRRGFTLLELLVVVGIMGFLGMASIAGYNALQRGMTERSVTAVASTLLRAAQERAQVDRVPTAVFCYNRLLKEPTGDEDNGVVVGVMTAIRRVGRISNVKGNLLFDEFADLDNTYEAVENANDAQKGGSFRLYRFGGETLSDMKYAIVSDRVVQEETAEQVTLFSNSQTGSSAASGSGPHGANQTGGGAQSLTNLMASAFCRISGGSDWKVGDGYALEFAETQLPAGYIFGTQVPSKAGDIKLIKTIMFKPDGKFGGGGGNTGSETIDIYQARPDGSGWPKASGQRVGEASSDTTKAI